MRTEKTEGDNSMTKEQKIKKDEKALEKYAERMKKARKVYIKTANAYAINNRRSRAAAIGACALQVMDEMRGLAKTRPLMDGTLDYMITEQKVKDPDGKIGFHATVAARVTSAEAQYTAEEIRAEIEDTRKRMMLETEQMYPQKDAEGNPVQ